MKSRKITAVILFLCLAASLCACSKSGDRSDNTDETAADTDATADTDVADDKDAILAVAETAVQAIAAADKDTILDIGTGLSDEYRSVFDRTILWIETDRAFKMVLDSMTSQVDDYTFDGNMVDVEFTMVDYEDIFNSNYHEDTSEVMDDLAVEEGTLTIIVTMEFEKIGDEWKVSNMEQVLTDAYAFTDPGYILTTDLHGDA